MKRIVAGLYALARLAGLRYEHATFGHGRAMLSGADRRFVARWGAQL